MASIKESDIKCPYLIEALSRAEKDAYDKKISVPSSTVCDDEYVQHLSLTKDLRGSNTCDVCGKIISVILRFKQLAAKDSNTGKSITVYTTILPEEIIGVSGHKCLGVP